MQIVNRRLALTLVGAMFLTLAPFQSLGRARNVINGRWHLHSSNAVVMKNQKFAFAIHGGAGTILKSNMTPEMENAYRAKLNEALDGRLRNFERWRQQFERSRVRNPADGRLSAL